MKIINLKLTTTVAAAILAAGCDDGNQWQTRIPPNSAVAEADMQICVDQNKVRVPDENCPVQPAANGAAVPTTPSQPTVPPAGVAQPPAQVAQAGQPTQGSTAPVVVNTGGGGPIFYPWFINSGGYYPSMGYAASSGSSTPITARSYRPAPRVATPISTPRPAATSPVSRGGFGSTAASSSGGVRGAVGG